MIKACYAGMAVIVFCLLCAGVAAVCDALNVSGHSSRTPTQKTINR